MANDVKVIFFGSLSDSVDRTEQQLNTGDAQTAEAVFNMIADKNAALHTARQETSIQVALNKELSSWTAEIADGDELAFFPPVTGG